MQLAYDGGKEGEAGAVPDSFRRALKRGVRRRHPLLLPKVPTSLHVP